MLGVLYAVDPIDFNSKHVQVALRPPLMRRSTSVMSDGSGDVSMEPLGEHSGGRVKRVGAQKKQNTLLGRTIIPIPPH